MFICRVISFKAFWKFIWLWNSAWVFLGVKFWDQLKARHTYTNPRPSQYLTHAHSHITRAVTTTDSPTAMPRWWAPIRAKQLSMAATARVIWLCACMRCCPGRGLVYVCFQLVVLNFWFFAVSISSRFTWFESGLLFAPLFSKRTNGWLSSLRFPDSVSGVEINVLWPWELPLLFYGDPGGTPIYKGTASSS